MVKIKHAFKGPNCIYIVSENGVLWKRPTGTKRWHYIEPPTGVMEYEALIALQKREEEESISSNNHVDDMSSLLG